jgi:hypothetical protein
VRSKLAALDASSNVAFLRGYSTSTGASREREARYDGDLVPDVEDVCLHT